MKRIILVICMLFFLSCCGACRADTKPYVTSTKEKTTEALPVRAVWITYYELQQFTQNRDADSFVAAVEEAFQKLFEWGFTTVTIHVRPCADAFYNSAYFPVSQYCFGEQGSALLYDPLALMCEAAHRNGLTIEAWINPYRVSQDNEIEALCDGNIAKEWYYNDDTASRVYCSEKGIYFNPAGEGVTELIVDGVTEIVKGYPVDAIHFDDYFYPTTKEEIDEAEYRQYCDNGGKMSLSDYRRDVVSRMVKTVYQAIKRINKAVLFGISPASDIQQNYDKLYADVARWATEEGFVDYIVPQIYFGFQNEVQPFMRTAKKWRDTAQCPLYVGLPLYKSGSEDTYASTDNEDAINEFVTHHNIIARQITYLSKLGKVQGFYLFSYGCLSDEQYAEEVTHLLEAMQNSSP